MKLFQEENRAGLSERIPDAAYYRNFTALALRLTPDGDRIRQVGFTLVRGREEQRVALTSRPTPGRLQPIESENGQPPVAIVGLLKRADEMTRNEVIGVVDPSGARHVIYVPKGMMSDIVKPLWGERVRVVAIRRKDGKLNLSQIDPAPDDANAPESAPGDATESAMDLP
ncbi:MAG: hypothetical protein B7Z73_18825 [Planctomycetia bacterium 21-64-5]|nr:MAG: hypothetical protein B7Z73_18825 [Planctomycetia bacterium 21-64-5]